MFLRVFSFLLLIVFVTSCDKFTFSKKEQITSLDTIVNFSSIDTSPSFKSCDSLINKGEKAKCFRNTIHTKIGAELAKHSFSIKDTISEIVFVELIINSKGEIVLEEIKSSESIKAELPELDSLLRVSVSKLPKIYPGIKRGIPVTTKYRLPIKIQLTE